ncbi:hypothetical protein LAG90_04955 [Marinilongibacter aquaticus]|uniref:hypothetical protein n=1 Tax=Marinilongibacter aquaticus TaxID=2975157 RepID=UPI0021BD364D|nr:hypothetical protein [Marinilongibacter aquaticus]UBM59998.1 hypothetical protein LAG90_04955 [Marinilongibacter aquaticus]
MEQDRMHQEPRVAKSLKGLVAITFFLASSICNIFGQTFSPPNHNDIEAFYDHIYYGERLHDTGAIHGILKIDSSGFVKKSSFKSSYAQTDSSFIRHKTNIESYRFSKEFADLTIEYLFVEEVKFSEDTNVDYRSAFLIVKDYMYDLSVSKYQKQDYYLISKENIKLLPIVVYSVI